MLVSFLSDGSYTLDIDQSKNTKLVFQDNLDSFDKNTKIPVLVGVEGEYEIVLIDYIPTESELVEKKAKIVQLLITSENYEEVDTEGITFEKSDIGPMVTARFFGGDPNAEVEYLQRWNYLKDIERTPQEDVELELIKKGYEAKEAFKNFILSIS